MKQERRPHGPEDARPPRDSALPRETARVLTTLLAQALALHELLDVASMREGDEVRLLAEGIVAGLRAATGTG